MRVVVFLKVKEVCAVPFSHGRKGVRRVVFAMGRNGMSRVVLPRAEEKCGLSFCRGLETCGVPLCFGGRAKGVAVFTSASWY